MNSCRVIIFLGRGVTKNRVEIEWPSQSPDLNPIEKSLVGFGKKRRKNAILKNVSELEATEDWDKTLQEHHQKLVSGCTTRSQQVITAKIKR